MEKVKSERHFSNGHGSQGSFQGRKWCVFVRVR